MNDLIRSPLQFVRPMTENEWQELVDRETRREIQRIKRRDARLALSVAEKPVRRDVSRRPVTIASNPSI